MAQLCSVCAHPERKAIDSALVSGQVSNRSVAKSYGLSYPSVRRHLAAHLVAQVAKRVQEASSYTDAIAADVNALREKALSLGAKAEASKDYRTALMAVRELTRLVELLHRVKLDDSRDARDVAMHPAWQRLRHALLTALGPFPEAQGAVIIAIQNELNAHAGPLPGGMIAEGVPEGGGG